MKRKQCDYYGNATWQRHVIALRSRAETGGESRATALDSPPVSALDRREITRVISLVICSCASARANYREITRPTSCLAWRYRT